MNEDAGVRRQGNGGWHWNTRATIVTVIGGTIGIAIAIPQLLAAYPQVTPASVQYVDNAVRLLAERIRSSDARQVQILIDIKAAAKSAEDRAIEDRTLEMQKPDAPPALTEQLREIIRIRRDRAQHLDKEVLALERERDDLLRSDGRRR